MAVRDELNNDAYEMNDMDGIVASVDLTVFPWNRSTIADGQWLQDHAIGPLSARDVYLADCIDGAFENIDNMSAAMQSLGIGTSGGSLGFSTKSMNANISKDPSVKADWSNQHAAIVPNSYSDSACPAGSLTYLTVSQEAGEVGGLPISQGQLAGIINCNFGAGGASQIGVSDKGLYFRYIGTDRAVECTYTVGTEQNSYWANPTPSDFKALPLFDVPNNGDYLVHVQNGEFSLGASTNIATQSWVSTNFAAKNDFNAVSNNVNTLTAASGSWLSAADLALTLTGNYITGMSGKSIIGPDDLANYQTTGDYLTTGNLSFGAAGNTFLNNISYNGTTWNVFDPAAHLASNGGLAWDAEDKQLSVSALSGRIDDTDTVKTLADIYGDMPSTANCLTGVNRDSTLQGDGTGLNPLGVAPIELTGYVDPKNTTSGSITATSGLAGWLQYIIDKIGMPPQQQN